MKSIDRDKYLNEIINVVDTPNIKVITGVRRFRKYKLLDAFYNYLTNSIEGNVIRIKLTIKRLVLMLIIYVSLSCFIL